MQEHATESADTRLALFDFAFEHAPIGIALVDTRGCIIRGNAVFARLTGIPLAEVQGKPFKDFTHPEDLAADLALFDEVLAGTRDGYTVEKRYVQPAGNIVHVRVHVAAMRNAKGRVARFISQIEDISEYKKAERKLAERAAQLELAMEAVRGGFWHMDVATGTFETSDRLAHFIGGPAAARLDLEAYLGRVNIEDGASADLTPLLAGEIDHSVAEYRLDTVSGQRWMRCDRRLLRGPDGKPLRIVGVAIDFTEQHRRLEELEANSQTDALTGLLNRRGLEKRFGKLASADGYGLLVLDLDGFKAVNDRHGHGAGDAVLVETAGRLAQTMRDGDLTCRTGGDEFVAVMTGSLEAAEAVARRIVQAMRDPVTVPGGIVDVRASVGGSWSPAKRDLARMMAQADAALYEAKAAGKDTWRLAPDASAG